MKALSVYKIDNYMPPHVANTKGQSEKIFRKKKEKLSIETKCA